MTVQKNLVKNIYIGNASATKFAITFDIPESHPEYLRVYIGSGSNVEETKNYTADLKAKTITYPKSGEPLPAGQKIIIMRELPLSQLLDLVNQGNYYAEDVEDALDILTLISQQISEKLSRALVFNVDIDTSMFDNIIPFEAGKSFRVSDDGTHIETTEDPAKVLPIAESLLAQTTQQATIATQKAEAAAESALSAADSEVNAETAMTQSRNSATLAQKWAESTTSPDGREDADSPTGDTMSAKEWALYAKQISLAIGNPVVSVEEKNGNLEVTKSNGDKNTIDIAKLPVGYEFFTFNPTVQTGVLQYLGGEYSRETYKDLWTWVEKQPDYVISESEWQEKAAANNGNVPFYSTGDGSTTFRVPSIKCWVKGANETGEIGQYLSAGAPEIGGTLTLGSNGFVSGLGAAARATKCFSLVQASEQRYLYPNTTDKFTAYDIHFKASDANKVYSNSDTIQPESIVGVWCVKAFGTVSNIGNQDVAELSAEVTRVGIKVNEVDSKVNELKTEIENNTAVLYINGGTAEEPAEVTINSRYVEKNPFQGYYVSCEAQVQYQGKWASTQGFIFSSGGYGVTSGQLLPDDNIIVQTGEQFILTKSKDDGNLFGDDTPNINLKNVPCRVLIRKLGKIGETQ